MPLQPLLIEVLADPVDKGPLLYFESRDLLYNPRRKVAYAISGSIPVMLPDEQVRRLSAEAKGGNHVFSVDLETQTVTAPSGEVFHFDIDPGRKEKLLKGLDAVGETLQHHEHIGGFEDRRKLTHPWLEKRR